MTMPIIGEALTAEPDLVLVTAEIVIAYVSKNETPVDEISDLIISVHSTLSVLGDSATSPQAEAKLEPAVSVRASVKPDHVTCLDCGFKGKMLKRHLAKEHGLTPAEYRARWSLPSEHPLVAPNYAERRRELALNIGLGRKPAGRA